VLNRRRTGGRLGRHRAAANRRLHARGEAWAPIL